MNIDIIRLDAAFSLVADGLEKQEMPAYLKKRWKRAVEKARNRLIEQPFFAWQPERLLIVSVPQEKATEFGCRFYEANIEACRRVDRNGLCQAFFEGFPCWHRAAFLLLKIYVGEESDAGTFASENQNPMSPFNEEVSTLVDTFS